MDSTTRRGVVAAAVVLVLVATVGLALPGGIPPLNGGDGDGSATPAATPTETDGDSPPTATAPDDGSSTATGTPTPVPEPSFAFEVDRIEQCGQTCRKVTSTISNVGGKRATDVTVTSRLYAGNSTASDDQMWKGNERVGTLDAGESHSATKRVELSFREALSVQNADGWVTIETTVESTQRSVTFTERRDVT